MTGTEDALPVARLLPLGSRLPENVDDAPVISEAADVKEIDVGSALDANRRHVRGGIQHSHLERGPAVLRAAPVARTLDHRLPRVLVDRRILAIGLVDVPLRETGVEALSHALGIPFEPALEVVARRLFDREQLVAWNGRDHSMSPPIGSVDESCQPTAAAAIPGRTWW